MVVFFLILRFAIPLSKTANLFAVSELAMQFHRVCSLLASLNDLTLNGGSNSDSPECCTTAALVPPAQPRIPYSECYAYCNCYFVLSFFLFMFTFTLNNLVSC